MIRGCPNRETGLSFGRHPCAKAGPSGPAIAREETTMGSETSQYHEEEKSTRFPQ